MPKLPYHWENQIHSALKQVKKRVLESLPDKFFLITIRGEPGRNGKQEIYVEGGPSKKFTILPEDMDETKDDSWSGSVDCEEKQ